MTEWATCEEWCAGECDGDPKWCRQLRAEAEAKLEMEIEKNKTGGAILMMCANDLKSAEAEILDLKAKLAAAIKDRDRDWYINDGKIAELEAEVKRLKAILKPLVAPTFKLDVPIEEAIKKGIPSREDDGRDSGE